MITNILLTIIILALIGLITWREAEHVKQVKDLTFLKKSDRPEEYAHYRSIDEPAKEEPVNEEEIELAETTPQEWAKLGA